MVSSYYIKYDSFVSTLVPDLPIWPLFISVMTTFCLRTKYPNLAACYGNHTRIQRGGSLGLVRLCGWGWRICVVVFCSRRVALLLNMAFFYSNHTVNLRDGPLDFVGGGG